MTKAEIGGISPFFIVTDIDRSLAFYNQLGFKTTFKDPDDHPFFGIVARDHAQLFMKSHDGLTPMPNTSRHPWIAWDAYLYVPDPDTLSAEFTARGVASSEPLKDTHDGLRGFQVRDPDGYVLFFGRPR